MKPNLRSLFPIAFIALHLATIALAVVVGFRAESVITMLMLPTLALLAPLVPLFRDKVDGRRVVYGISLLIATVITLPVMYWMWILNDYFSGKIG